MRGRALIVDDDAEMRAFVVDALSPLGFAVEATGPRPPEELLRAADAMEAEVVLTDLRMPKVSGLDVCAAFVAGRPDVPVLLMTAFGDLEAAIGAIRAGAWDFLVKPVDVEVIALALDRAVALRRLKLEVRRLRETADDVGGGPRDLHGRSPAIQAIWDLVHSAAAVTSTVLVTGESGTGKELVARALHAQGPRRDGPFVAVNCAAVPDQLLESQLFGHVRGAFTDAKSDQAGMFAQAHGGTLFLDEIGEMPLALQPKILRALQERSVRPVGGGRELPFDVRVIAATNRDLDAAVAEGSFREDLFYRVNVIHIELPPLRARGDDVLLLAQRFIKRFAAELGRPVKGISPAAAALLRGYSWPGNVRELQNAIERAVALTRFEEITPDDLPPRLRGAPTHATEIEPLSLTEVERRHILAVFESVRGNRARAAEILGVDRKTLYRKLLSYGVS